MRSTPAIATLVTIAIMSATGHPYASRVDMPPAQGAAESAVQAGQSTEFAWSGNWKGTTASGVELMLQLQLRPGQRVAGSLTVGKQSAKILDGKIVDPAFALTTGPIDGHKVDATGRRVGPDAIEFTIEGVKDPLMLTRVS